MAFGDNFVNISEMLTEGVNDPDHVRDVFKTAIMMLGGSTGLGGTLYVPSVVGTTAGNLPIDVINVDGSSMVIPPNIELRVASGATLLPVVPSSWDLSDTQTRARAALEIQGAFQAPLTRVFLPPRRFAEVAGSVLGAWQAGTVRFAGRAMERVHPEWWGAGTFTDDSDALDEAVRAAVHERYELLATGQRRWLRPLVIELLGTYRISRPLLIARFARSDIRAAGLIDIISVGDGAIELRGAPGGMDTPTFRCTDDFDTAQSMVVVNGFESSTFDEVCFDGNRSDANGGDVSRAESCLLFYSDTLSLPASLNDVPASGHHLRRCGFQGATAALVEFRHLGPTTDQSNQNTPMLDRQEVHLEGCQFAPQRGPKGPPLALRVMVPNTWSVDVRGCIFDGVANAMIYAQSCALSVTNCQFRNQSSVGMPAPGSDNPHANGPAGGLDIFLDRAPGDVCATLYAQDCRTTSPQFLAQGSSAESESQNDSNSTIVALHHVGADDMSAPSAIAWRVPTGLSAPRLTLIGCRFDRYPMAREPAVTGAPRTIIADLGAFNGRIDDRLRIDGVGATVMSVPTLSTL